MRNGRNWPTKMKEYTNADGAVMTDEEIKDKWEKIEWWPQAVAFSCIGISKCS